MAQQRVRRVADQIRGRLVAGYEQQQHEHRHLGRAQAGTILRRNEDADQIIAGLLGPLRHDAANVLRELLHGLGEAAGERVDRACRARRARDDSVGPLLEIVSPLRFHAEDLADHAHRQRHGERRHQVDLLGMPHFVHARAGEFAHARLPHRDASRREAAVDEVAHRGVPRRILGDQVARTDQLFHRKRQRLRQCQRARHHIGILERVDARTSTHEHRPHGVGGEQFRVAENELHVIVPRHTPGLGPLRPVDRASSRSAA